MPKYRDLQSLTKLLETHTPLNSKLKMLKNFRFSLTVATLVVHLFA